LEKDSRDRKFKIRDKKQGKDKDSSQKTEINEAMWVMVLNAIFNNISVIYSVGQFYLWMKPEYLEKTIDLPQVTKKHVN
jgi:hypothetical protein